MQRQTLLCLTLATALVALPALGADRSMPRGEQEQLEALVGDLEELIGTLDGDPQPIFRKLGNGYSSMVISLSATDSERLEGIQQKRSRKTANFKAMDAGHSKAQPRKVTKLITHPSSKTQVRYWFWFCVYNLNNNAVTRNVTHKLKGPGETFDNRFPFQFSGDSIGCLWFRHAALGEAGRYTSSLKVSTGGTVKENFIAQ